LFVIDQNYAWEFRSSSQNYRAGELEMTAIDEAAGAPENPKREDGEPQSSQQAGKSGPDSDLLTVTVHAKTGQVVKIESAGGPGSPHELSTEEMANLAKEEGEVTLEALLEQAFEAGIACMLGGGTGKPDAGETEEEADLRHLLLRPLMRRSPVEGLKHSDVLRRAMLGTMIRHKISPRPSGP